MEDNRRQLSGNIVDVLNGEIYSGTVQIADGKIVEIVRDEKTYNQFILPGFVDAHVHIESSMLVPSEFARLAVLHGTVATVSDPHEIGNVLGIDGVKYMIDNGKKVPFKFNFGAPSCVPATNFETAGAEIDPAGVRELLELEEIKYLSEMMNYPGVINNDPVVHEKIKIARELGLRVDGHAPGLRGEGLQKYVVAGIETDHESYQLDEALEKIELGMKILIREGSAAKNFEELFPLIDRYPNQCMLCSDDKHPDNLVEGHIDELARRAVAKGADVMKVLRVACVNPVLHYNLDVGLLRKGDPADCILVDNLTDFTVQATYIDGKLVAEKGSTLIGKIPVTIVNNFSAHRKTSEDFKINADGEMLNVINALDGQLITEKSIAPALVRDGNVCSDIDNDILKIAVVNRYENVKPALGFIRNFGLKRGAIASSVAHDSHNIIAVGVEDEDICRAVNLLMENRGGLSVVDGSLEEALPLPIAGLMTDQDGFEVAQLYSRLDETVKRLGTKLRSPYMTLSFMALLVIPAIKMSDKGLFDGESFQMMNVFQEA